MDDRELVDGMDALWFFSNLLSSHGSLPSPGHRPDHSDSPPPPRPRQGEAPKRARTLALPQTREPPPPLTGAHHPAKEAPPATSAASSVDGVLPEAPGMAMVDQRRRRRWKSCRESGQEAAEEITRFGIPLLGSWKLDAGPSSSSSSSSVDTTLRRTVRLYGLAAAGRCGCRGVGEDDWAVREHLRSWAHAVACTVTVR